MVVVVPARRHDHDGAASPVAMMVMMVVVVVMMVVIELSHLDLGLGGAGGLLIERLQLGRRVWYRLK